MFTLDKMTIDLYADGASLSEIQSLAANPLVKGFTTNPSLMRKAGVENYERFAHEMLEIIGDKPVSFEVFADDLSEMEWQARKIASWSPSSNIYVKIPITNTAGVSTGPVIRVLQSEGIQINVTAVFTARQALELTAHLGKGARSIVSVFAGRIADAGFDPVAMLTPIRSIFDDLVFDDLELTPKLLWASPRQLLDIWHAQRAGCQIITVTPEILRKLNLFGKDLHAYSLETVRMFYEDAAAAGYEL